MNSPPQDVRIRRMIQADLNRLVEIAQSLAQAPQWKASAYAKAIDPGETPRRIALVATGPADEAPLGFLVASLIPPEAELETIAVNADAQRHGIGGRLLRALLEELRKEYVKTLILEVRASNSGAINFYQQNGLELIGRRPRYYANPPEDAVLMRLNLD
jgi:ribosomal-protein-alanine acetyltransferase